MNIKINSLVQIIPNCPDKAIERIPKQNPPVTQLFLISRNQLEQQTKRKTRKLIICYAQNKPHLPPPYTQNDLSLCFFFDFVATR